MTGGVHRVVNLGATDRTVTPNPAGRAHCSAAWTARPDAGISITTREPVGRAVAVLRLGATLAALGVGQAILWHSGSALPVLPHGGAGRAALLAEAEPVSVATTLRRLPDGPSTTTLRRLPDGQPPPGPTLRHIPDGQPAPPRPGPAPEAAATREEVVVRPGDSFWRLAERHETERLGRRPSDAEVGVCWQQMIGANRHRLVVPGDPDLIYPGQLLILPCP